MKVGQSEFVAAINDNKLYCFDGLWKINDDENNPLRQLDSVESFNNYTGKWKDEEIMPRAMAEFGAVTSFED